MNGRHPLSPARRVVLCGLLAGVTAALKAVMDPLPNIEPVSLLLLAYALTFGGEAVYIAFTFAMLEGLLYGFGLWWFSYLYVWPLWTLLGTRLRLEQGAPALATACGGFGLSFGALCTLPYLAGGPWAALSVWVAGIPFDLVHCAGNFLLTLALINPLCRLLRRLRDGM